MSKKSLVTSRVKRYGESGYRKNIFAVFPTTLLRGANAECNGVVGKTERRSGRHGCRLRVDDEWG